MASASATAAGNGAVSLERQEAAEMAFKDYDFESDEGWQRTRSNLFIVSELDREKALFASKRKFFKNNINSDLAKEEVSVKPSRSSPSSSLSWSRRLRITANYVRLFLEANVIISTFLYILSFSFPSFSQLFFHLVLGSSVLSSIIDILVAHGIPKFKAELWQPIVSHEGFQCMFAYLALLTSQPFAFALLPNVIRAALFVSMALNQAVLPLISPRIHVMVSPLLNKVLSQSIPLSNLCANLELFVLFLLVGFLFTSNRNIVLLFLYSQFIRLRYLSSSYCQAACRGVRVSCDTIFCSRMCPPMISKLYQKIVSFVYSFVDPVALQNAQQQQRKCTIQ